MVSPASSSSNALPESAIRHVNSVVRVADLDLTQMSSARAELPPLYTPV